MGVKGFNSWFGKTYAAAYVPVKRRYDHLYIDMASLLHEVTRKGAGLLLYTCISCLDARHPALCSQVCPAAAGSCMHALPWFRRSAMT
jgi:hypothetical protein